MDHQITASTHMGYEAQQGKFWVTVYTGSCGCSWSVDMWGNVRRARVCGQCMKKATLQDQLVFDLNRPADVE